MKLSALKEVNNVLLGVRHALASAKKHLMCPSMSVYLSAAFFPTGIGNLHDRGSLLCNNIKGCYC
jgi:Ser-tRNA(Ala) deacylase AlaX